jgi:hypothetical protein
MPMGWGEGLQSSQKDRHNHAVSGWRIHCGVEVTELSTNKQLSLSVDKEHFACPYKMKTFDVSVNLLTDNLLWIQNRERKVACRSTPEPLAPLKPPPQQPPAHSEKRESVLFIGTQFSNLCLLFQRHLRSLFWVWVWVWD